MVRPRRNAHAKKLAWHYTKLRREYEYRMRCRISRLRKEFRLFALLSKDSGQSSLLSEMSSLSSNSQSSTHGLNSDSDGETEESTSDDSWADILGSDWRGRTTLGSDTSIASELWPTNISDIEIPELVSVGHGSDSSSSSGYSGDADSDFDSDMLEFSNEDDVTSLLGYGRREDFDVGDRWARLRRWIHQQLEEMYSNLNSNSF